MSLIGTLLGCIAVLSLSIGMIGLNSRVTRLEKHLKLEEER